MRFKWFPGKFLIIIHSFTFLRATFLSNRFDARALEQALDHIMSASPREFTTMDDAITNSMPIAQLEVALALNYGVFKAKEASAVGDAVCITYLATVKPIRAKLPSLKRNALGAYKTAALPVADDANDEPATDDAESEPIIWQT
jgi:hypothetical protein